MHIYKGPKFSKSPVPHAQDCSLIFRSTAQADGYNFS